MNLNITKQPDSWVVIKIPNNEFKIFGFKYGGYIEGDEWYVNSGIKEVKEDELNYYFIGYSGSCYKCNKNHYGITNNYGQSILNKLVRDTNYQIKILDNINWKKHLNEK